MFGFPLRPLIISSWSVTGWKVWKHTVSHSDHSESIPARESSDITVIPSVDILPNNDETLK